MQIRSSKFTTYLHLSQTLVNPFFRPVQTVEHEMELSENVKDVFTGVDWNYVQLDHDRFVLSRSVDNLIVNTTE